MAPGKLAWLGFSPWLIIGVMFILTPIFFIMTFDNIRKHKEHTIQIFAEKGDALIRALEAGARSGLMEKRDYQFYLQKLLMETAQQRDIDFITITDVKGTIIADSDPSLIGEFYGEELDLHRISRSAKIAWRLVSNPDGIDTFEVFRRFFPAGIWGEAPLGSTAAGPQRDEAFVPLVIFIGLNVGPIEAARKDAMRNTILLALLLFFIGVSGIVSLLLAQGYRAARMSLARIKVFSNSLVENMPVGLVALDSKGLIVSFNQTAETILQLTSPRVIGKHVNQSLPQPFQEIIRASDIKQGVVEKEIDCFTAAGKTIPLEVLATALKADNGDYLGSILIFRDLSEVKHLKKEIARSQRLASLGNLAAGVAHEIRNPLSSIKGFAVYFKERYRSNPEDGEKADIMVQEVDRLNRVITQLLDFSRPLPVDKRPASLEILIRQAVSVIEPQALEKQVTIITGLEADLPEVLIDADKIKQVILNLCLNALAAMEQGGVLDIRLTRRDDSVVNIDISDNGTGIAEKDLAHIFDPYFTTKSSGTGLGLSIVHKIIEAHEGEISVTSAPGKGATFSIQLPVPASRGNFT